MKHLKLMSRKSLQLATSRVEVEPLTLLTYGPLRIVILIRNERLREPPLCRAPIGSRRNKCTGHRSERNHMTVFRFFCGCWHSDCCRMCVQQPHAANGQAQAGAAPAGGAPIQYVQQQAPQQQQQAPLQQQQQQQQRQPQQQAQAPLMQQQQAPVQQVQQLPLQAPQQQQQQAAPATTTQAAAPVYGWVSVLGS